MIHTRWPGSADLAQNATDLASRIPRELGVFARLAYNYRWSWMPNGAALFGAIEPKRWRMCGQNPVRLLQECSTRALERAAADRVLIEGAVALERAIEDELAQPSAATDARLARPTAFFCAEYGIHGSLPTYAGGLGMLAGDIVKEASDENMPLVAVGLLYHQGYFHQRLDASGWQHEYWVDVDADRLPIALVTKPDGSPLTVSIPIDAADVIARIWRVDVGRVPIFLLDTDDPGNSRFYRTLTWRLYVSDREVRRAQYLLLGVGGVRALRALGIDPSVVHLNEGHAAFATLELVREELEAGQTLADALERTRARSVFTTHTPVSAGNESYNAQEILATAGRFAASLQIGDDAFLELGRLRPSDHAEGFGLTPLAIRTCRSTNAVSQRHGYVSRAMWQAMWPDRPVDVVPITHVTNGVHVPTWIAPAMRELFDRYLGRGWERRAADASTWDRIDLIPDKELWATRNQLRRALVDYVRERSVVDRVSRGDRRDYVDSAERTFDSAILTVGFARRLATYKRLSLITHAPERALRLLSGGRPLQLIIAGKAHPQDDEAKRIVQQQLFPLRSSPQVGGHVVYLEEYDMAMAAQLVAGCDVWVNLPRPPLEASGTSGMKAAFNGCLNLSVLDGWWAEAYDGTNGWGIGGEPTSEIERQDARDADTFYHLVENEIVPLFYQHDSDGFPRGWVRRIKQSLRSIGPKFCATRMVREYSGKIYPTE